MFSKYRTHHPPKIMLCLDSSHCKDVCTKDNHNEVRCDYKSTDGSLKARKCNSSKPLVLFIEN